MDFVLGSGDAEVGQTSFLPDVGKFKERVAPPRRPNIKSIKSIKGQDTKKHAGYRSINQESLPKNTTPQGCIFLAF